MMGLVLLKEEETRAELSLSLSLCHVRTQQEGSHLKT